LTARRGLSFVRFEHSCKGELAMLTLLGLPAAVRGASAGWCRREAE
jgi:hypothetical protein